MDGGQREKGRNKSEKSDQCEAKLERHAFGALGRVQFGARSGGGRDGIIPDSGGATARDDGNFFKGNAGLFGDSAGPAKRRRVAKPFFAPLAPVDRHHVEFGKLEERGNSSARLAGGGDSASVGGIFEAARPEIREDGYDNKNHGITPRRTVLEKTRR